MKVGNLVSKCFVLLQKKKRYADSNKCWCGTLCEGQRQPQSISKPSFCCFSKTLPLMGLPGHHRELDRKRVASPSNWKSVELDPGFSWTIRVLASNQLPGVWGEESSPLENYCIRKQRKLQGNDRQPQLRQRTGNETSGFSFPFGSCQPSTTTSEAAQPAELQVFGRWKPEYWFGKAVKHHSQDLSLTTGRRLN